MSKRRRERSRDQVKRAMRSASRDGRGKPGVDAHSRARRRWAFEALRRIRARVAWGRGGRVSGRAPAASNISSRQSSMPRERAGPPSSTSALRAEGRRGEPRGRTSPRLKAIGSAGHSEANSKAIRARDSPTSPRKATVMWRSEAANIRRPAGAGGNSAHQPSPLTGNAMNQLGIGAG